MLAKGTSNCLKWEWRVGGEENAGELRILHSRGRSAGGRLVRVTGLCDQRLDCLTTVVPLTITHNKELQTP